MAMSAEDLQKAVDARIRLRRHIHVVRGKTSGRMAPEGLLWNEAADFAQEADNAQWWLGQLMGEVRRLQKAIGNG